MAWQSSGGMVGNGGSANGGSEASGNAGQPHGTEYTLQGAQSRENFPSQIMALAT